MPMRFYAVRPEAVELTHRALQSLQQTRKGSSLPSRALRVATLYGHLQCRAGDDSEVQVGMRELAAAWHLQPREVRADLQDLEALGWLRYSSGSAGLRIRLQAVQSAGADEAMESPPAAALLDRFCALYNQHRPTAWPAYSPRGSALAGRLQRAVRHAGDEQAFWGVMRRALAAMPDFWRTTYPQGRSGAECAAVLLSADRNAAGLGVEFWHVFCWGATATGSSDGSPPASDLERARQLLYWHGDHWHGRCIEAAKLALGEKQRLAELLEAAGDGVRGKAAVQFSQPQQRR
jgi:hypothetical protein